MVLAFFESFKYVGHLWPIAFFRVIIGYQYFDSALQRYKDGYFSNAYINESIRLGLPTSIAPEWYQAFLDGVVQDNWRLFTYIITSTEFLIGLSFLFGYLVRPFSILACLLCLNLMWALGEGSYNYYQNLLLINFTLLLLGAGRCLGFDYYFYRSRRGIWW